MKNLQICKIYATLHPINFIVLQKDIFDKYATGWVDYALKSLEAFLCITEGKTMQ